MDKDFNMTSPHDTIEKQEQVIALASAMMDLSESERKIIFMRYGINCESKTLREISEEFNLTKERIRQIQVEIMNKIKSQKIIREML